MSRVGKDKVSVHKDLAGLAREAASNGAELKQQGAVVAVIKDGTVVCYLPTARSHAKPRNINSVRSELRAAGLLNPPRTRQKTNVELAFEDAEQRRLEAVARQEDEAAQRTERKPADVGIIQRPARPVAGPADRYTYQAEWAVRVVKRVKKVSDAFKSPRELVEFAIEIARARGIDPPFQRVKKEEAAWDVDRILEVFYSMMSGRSKAPKSKTLLFFEALCDEMEGRTRILVGDASTTVPPRSLGAAIQELDHDADEVLRQDEDRVVGVKVFADEVAPPPPVQRALETSNLVEAYAAQLIAKIANDPNPRADILDRIERALGLTKEE